MSPRRWTSRKFLLSLSVQLTAIAVLIWPAHESAIVELSQSVTALLVMLLTTLGYVSSEASLDRSSGQGVNQSKSTDVRNPVDVAS
ncbi:MAG: hypothetical protein AAGH99_08535 [Planctomycetota bacterium]